MLAGLFSIALTLAPILSPQDPREPRVLIRPTENQQILPTSTSATIIHGDDSYIISSSTSVENPTQIVRVSFRKNSHSEHVAVFSNELFRKVDLSSSEYRIYRMEETNSVIYSFRFGDKNECFTNDDGRGMAYVVFDGEGEISISIINYEECEPSQMSLPVG